jgi:hypothetical protein
MMLQSEELGWKQFYVITNDAYWKIELCFGPIEA